MNALISYIRQGKAIDPIGVMEVLNTMSKEDSIAFLIWNDPSGIYTDERSEKEGFSPLTESEAKLLCMKQLWENATAA